MPVVSYFAKGLLYHLLNRTLVVLVVKTQLTSYIMQVKLAITMKLDPVWLQIFSELLVNLSAGWLAAAIIIPFSSRKLKRMNFWFLTADLVWAIIFLILAFEFRKQL